MVKALILFVLIVFNLFGGPNLIFLELKNDSKYKGKWDLSKELSIALKEYINKTGKYNVRVLNFEELEGFKKEFTGNPIDKAQFYYFILEQLSATMLFEGTIDKFDISTYGVVSPGLGGYTSYKGANELTFHIYNREKKKKSTFVCEGKETSHNLGFTILGGPGGRNDNIDLIEKLETLKFGSVLFYKTILGRAVEQCFSNANAYLLKKLPVDFLTIEGKIVDIDKNYIYINIGFRDKIIEGQKLTVIKQGIEIKDPDTGELLGYREKEICELEITRIISASLSKIKISDKKIIKKLMLGMKIKTLQ